MKKMFKKIVLVPIMLTALIITSCTNDEEENVEDVNFSTENSIRTAQTDNAIEGTLNIMENGFVESQSGRSPITSFFTSCTTITITTNGNGGTIVLDFGDMCQLNNGSRNG